MGSVVKIRLLCIEVKKYCRVKCGVAYHVAPLHRAMAKGVSMVTGSAFKSNYLLLKLLFHFDLIFISLLYHRNIIFCFKKKYHLTIFFVFNFYFVIICFVFFFLALEYLSKVPNWIMETGRFRRNKMVYMSWSAVAFRFIQFLLLFIFFRNIVIQNCK